LRRIENKDKINFKELRDRGRKINQKTENGGT